MRGKRPLASDDAVKLWIANNQYSMHRFTLFAGVETVGLGGWYVLCNDGHAVLASLLIFVITLIGVCLWFLSEYEREEAKRYWEYLKRLHHIPKRETFLDRGDGERPLLLKGPWMLRYPLILLGAVNVVLFFGGCSCLVGVNYWSCKV